MEVGYLYQLTGKVFQYQRRSERGWWYESGGGNENIWCNEENVEWQECVFKDGMYERIVVLTVMYQSELWRVKVDERNKLSIAKMKYMMGDDDGYSEE